MGDRAGTKSRHGRWPAGRRLASLAVATSLAAGLVGTAILVSAVPAAADGPVVSSTGIPNLPGQLDPESGLLGGFLQLLPPPAPPNAPPPTTPLTGPLTGTPLTGAGATGMTSTEVGSSGGEARPATGPAGAGPAATAAEVAGTAASHGEPDSATSPVAEILDGGRPWIAVLLLALAAVGFLILHAAIDRRDPRVMAAPRDRLGELLRFK